ncbi:MAG TPA: proton-conducting transporter membrane subunit [Thermoplasmata archaeon]|nr:proton-conducting transporter membrane subunit [Thermoplasmata archaeon]
MNVADPRLWITVLLLAPILGAVLALIPYRVASQAAARSASLATFVAASALLGLRAAGRWGPFFGLDALSNVFLFTVAAIYATSVWYSSGYLRAVNVAFLSPQTYYALMSVFALAMLASLLVTDLGLMWIGIEATTIASALLIVLERKPSSVEAAWRYTLIASAGLTIALFALLLLYEPTGTLDAFALAAHHPAPTLVVQMAVALALVGYGTKVGLFPMHTWLPDAHSEAPSPVSALFSGVLLPTALYAFLRVYRVLATPVPVGLSDLALAFGLTTALVAAFLLQRQRSFKRLLAYSSMEVMGLAVVGIALGGVALYGALVLLVSHAFAKSAAFYCAGNVLRGTGTTRIESIRDLRSRMPATSTAWILAAPAVTGAPPFGTFVGELLIVVGAVAVGADWLAVLVIVAVLVAFLGLNSQIGAMVFGRGDRPPAPVAEGAETGVSFAFLNVGIALALGLISLPYLSEALRAAALLLGGQLP